VTVEPKDLVLEPAEPSGAQTVARLIYDTGRNFFGYFYSWDLRFYLRMRMEIPAETRVPALDEPGHVPPHYRMVKALA